MDKLNDKIQHFVGCAFITFIGFLLTDNILAGAALGMSVGIGKEIYDELYGTGFDWRDIVADGLGVLVAIVFLGSM